MAQKMFIGNLLRIPSLARLKCSHQKGALMVSLKQFHSFMKSEHDPSCGREHPRKFNVKKELGKHLDSIKTNDDIYFSITALLRYMFHHSNEYKVCKDTVNDVIAGLTIPNTEDCPDVCQRPGSTTKSLNSRAKAGQQSDDHCGRQTVMKKKNKPRKITQDELQDNSSFDFLSDLVDGDSDFEFLDEFQTDNTLPVTENGNKIETTESQNLHRSEVEKFINGKYSDKEINEQLLTNDGTEESTDEGSPDDTKDSDSPFCPITDTADSNDTVSSKHYFDQEYQYVLETGEVPREEYDAYEQMGEACLKCNLCNKRFSTPGNLKTHVRTHTGEKPYFCQFCNKRFTTKGNLDVHVRTHTGERPYKCLYCDKYFSTIGNRQVHMRTHTQERPFSCKICHKPFSTKANLSTHMKTHSGRRDHECTFCGKAYTTLANLQTHMRTHNPFIQSFLPNGESPNTSDSEQGPSQSNTMNLGMNNILQSQNLLGNLGLFNPGLFLPMTMPLGMNSFLPPNLMIGQEASACLDLSGKEEKKNTKALPSSSTTRSLESSSDVKNEKSQKRHMDQDDKFRSKSLKQAENNVEIPNGFLPNLAFLNHVNFMNSLAFSVPGPNH